VTSKGRKDHALMRVARRHPRGHCDNKRGVALTLRTLTTAGPQGSVRRAGSRVRARSPAFHPTGIVPC
jgi:hypothetical protein